MPRDSNDIIRDLPVRRRRMVERRAKILLAEEMNSDRVRRAQRVNAFLQRRKRRES